MNTVLTMWRRCGNGKQHYKGSDFVTQLEIWAMIAQSALNYIFISIISANNQKMTVTDMKTDLRTTKEDVMAELKDSRKNIIEMLELIEKQQEKGNKGGS